MEIIINSSPQKYLPFNPITPSLTHPPKNMFFDFKTQEIKNPERLFHSIIHKHRVFIPHIPTTISYNIYGK